MQEPYDIDREQIIFRARAIYKNNRRQLIVWAALYMILLYGFFTVNIFVTSEYARVTLSRIRLLLMPLLMGMYAWLHNILHGKDRAFIGLFDPFRWIKTRSLGRFLLLALVIILAGLIQSHLTGEIDRRFLVIFIEPLDSLIRPAFNEDSITTAIYLLIPIILVPTFLMLQWLVDYFCIHAVQTEGRKAFGIIDSFFSIYGDTIRIEARLIFRTLWIPYAVYYAICILAVFLQSLTVVIPILTLLMSFTFLGFGLVYYPLSAIARFLLIMQQPRKIPLPEEPIDFHEIDAAYAAYRKEREEYRRAKDEEKARQKAEEEADEDEEA